MGNNENEFVYVIMTETGETGLAAGKHQQIPCEVWNNKSDCEKRVAYLNKNWPSPYYSFNRVRLCDRRKMFDDIYNPVA